MKINKDGYPEIEIYGLKIRSSEDERIEIDVREAGNYVERIYIEFDFDEGYALIRTHNGEVNQKKPFHKDSFSKYFSDMGKKGGSAKTDAKQKSSRENGKLGGRSKKEKE